MMQGFGTIKSKAGSIFRSYGIMIVLLIMIGVVSIISPVFFSIDNLLNILRQVSVIGILSLGTTYVIILKNLDLSVGSIVSLTGIVTMLIINSTQNDILAMGIALLVGVGAGIINGVIVAAVNGGVGASFMITYGTLTAFQAVALIVCRGAFVTGSTTTLIHSVLGKGYTPIIIFLVLAVIFHFVLVKTPFGRTIMFIGSNVDAAKMSGINIKKYIVIVFVISSVMATLASIILCSRVNAASPVAGKNYEFEAVTAVVVGGTSLNGGKGGIINTILGVIVIGVISNTLNLLNVSPFLQMVFKGIIIILEVILDVVNQKSIAKELVK